MTSAERSPGRRRTGEAAGSVSVCVHTAATSARSALTWSQTAAPVGGSVRIELLTPDWLSIQVPRLIRDMKWCGSQIAGQRAQTIGVVGSRIQKCHMTCGQVSMFAQVCSAFLQASVESLQSGLSLALSSQV